MNHNRFVKTGAGLLILALLLAACGQAVTPAAVPQGTETTGTEAVEEEEEYHWVQLLGRDDIAPIYQPEFVPAGQAGYDDRDLVMGIEIDGQAKAYPVGLLNRREMVNDEMGGIPYLVTW